MKAFMNDIDKERSSRNNSNNQTNGSSNNFSSKFPKPEINDYN